VCGQLIYRWSLLPVKLQIFPYNWIPLKRWPKDSQVLWKFCNPTYCWHIESWNSWDIRLTFQNRVTLRVKVFSWEAARLKTRVQVSMCIILVSLLFIIISIILYSRVTLGCTRYQTFQLQLWLQLLVVLGRAFFYSKDVFAQIEYILTKSKVCTN